MRPVQVQVVGVGNSPVIPPDQYLSPFNLSLFVDVVSGVVDATVQYTFDDVFSPTFDPGTATWFPHADLTNVAADSVGTIISPVSGVRIINAGAGTVNLRLIQAGIQ